MRFLRMLTNALLGGLLGAAFVTVLVLQLNYQLPLTPSVVGPLVATLAAFYGAHIAAFFYLLIVLKQLTSRDVMSPGWVSVQLLAWESAIVTAGAAALMWWNVTGFRRVLDDEGARRMAAGAAATTVCALLLLLIAVVRYSVGRKASRASAVLFVVAVVAAIGLPLAARGAGRTPPIPARSATGPPGQAVEPPGRVVLVLVDGASLEFIAPATAEGRLPNFGRMLDAGASMHLSTFRPTQPGPVWMSALTGKYPPATGVRSAATYAFGPDDHPIELLPDLLFARALVHLGFLDERPGRATSVASSPLWRIAGRYGITVGVVGVPLTDPVEPVRGYLVSDQARRAGNARLASEDQTLAYPPDIFDMVSLPADDALGERVELGEVPPDSVDGRGVSSGVTSRDAWYERLYATLDDGFRPTLGIVRYTGVDIAAHYYLRYAQPGAFGDVAPEERERYGRVLERHYAHVDAQLERLLDGLGAGDVLIVASGFGIEPVTLGKRLLARALGQPRLTGSHEGAPDGFLLAFGGPVARARLPVGAVVDLAPTVLYLLGIPVGRDMDGVARTDLFRSEFSSSRPIAFIPSHE